MKHEKPTMRRREGTVPAEKLLALLLQTASREVAYEKFNELIGVMVEEQEENKDAETGEERGHETV